MQFVSLIEIKPKILKIPCNVTFHDTFEFLSHVLILMGKYR